MARRIKEEPGVHRKRIADGAEKLFLKEGIDKTSVSQIAAEAGYSKATLYVYFENKEEIISYLVLRSMQVLKKQIIDGTDSKKTSDENFLGVCNAIYTYKKKYPMYFDFLQETINVDFSSNKYYESEKETFEVGESINEYIIELFDLKEDAFIKLFTTWGAVCGVIKMADKKVDYIKKCSEMSEEEYLQEAFKKLIIINL
ncbi:MAG: TetR/AcrR family transcriptional regulator [Pseudobutyrivibrio sp.]|uniref:TetR/AcrR family transcriptional regulator n=1 Tax=Pseudobutyrivibrio sp. TaxID=2014367 RepID=UPI0025D7013B|nr:TetR/AcrR family transcriptional regulator [Pseudobutyrivibrio sp.]MBQ6462894.1 TetR/AcrR family transcriptional regulator [Pseudobutyrivibrio sp.]